MGLKASKDLNPTEETIPEQASADKPFTTPVSVDDVDFETSKHIPDTIPKYCKLLLYVGFYGQTGYGDKDTDHMHTKHVLHLGLYLQLVDKLLRNQKKVTDITGTEEEYIQLLNLVAVKRRRDGETTNQRLTILQEQSARFIEVYHKRGAVSEELNHDNYWGTRQQMLAGKVIADWVDAERGPLDPIFGVLLNPTAGRVGPGDTGWFHEVLFDDTGFMAYHSAVHDGFGYLNSTHNVGPGYDYLDANILDDSNPMAGQISGIEFWKAAIEEVKKKHKIVEMFKL